MQALGNDPIADALNGVLVTLRDAYRGTHDTNARKAIAAAGSAVAGALAVAESPKRDKELAARIRTARRAMRTAAAATPSQTSKIHAAMVLLPRVRGYG